MMKHTYFITDGDFVKIGSSKNVERRFHDIQVSNPKKLKFLGSTEIIEEYKLLSYYKSKHSYGEWFHYDVKLKSEIEGILNGVLPDGLKPATHACITDFELNSLLGEFSERTGIKESTIKRAALNFGLKTFLSEQSIMHAPNLKHLITQSESQKEAS